MTARGGVGAGPSRILVVGAQHHTLVEVAAARIGGHAATVVEPGSAPAQVLGDADVAAVVFDGAGANVVERLSPWLDAAIGRGDLAIVVLAEALPLPLVRTLLRAPACEIVSDLRDAEELSRALGRVLAPRDPTRAAGATVWTFTGAVGGAGATSIAIETAYALRRRAKAGARVLLADLNFADGAAAAYLDLKPALDLAEAERAADRLDAAMLGAFVVGHAAGFDLLAGPRAAPDAPPPSAEAVVRLLEVASEAYDHIVVDLPRWRLPWTFDVFAGADEVVVVSEITVPALHAARALANDIELAVAPAREPRIVLNRISKRWLGAGVSLADAEKALRGKAAGAVTSDWEAALSAVNLGAPISHVAPKSRIGQDVAALVETLMASRAEAAAPASAPPPQPAKGRLFPRPKTAFAEVRR